jgi:hypothetical protein
MKLTKGLLLYHPESPEEGDYILIVSKSGNFIRLAYNNIYDDETLTTKNANSNLFAGIGWKITSRGFEE